MNGMGIFLFVSTCYIILRIYSKTLFEVVTFCFNIGIVAAATIKVFTSFSIMWLILAIVCWCSYFLITLNKRASFYVFITDVAAITTEEYENKMYNSGFPEIRKGQYF